jgi:amino acid transporter
MAELKRVLGFWTILSLAIASIMGTGLFFGTSIGSGYSGNASILSWVILSIAAVLISMYFAELSSMYPRAGGIYEFSKHAYSRFSSFLMGWVAWLVGNLTTALLVVAAIDYLVPDSSRFWLKIGISIMFIIILNIIALFGIEASAFLLVIFALTSISVLLSIILPGIFSISAANYSPFFAFGISSIFVAIFFIAESFFGWESATYLAEETKEPEKTIPRAIVIGTIIVGVLGILTAAVSLGIIPWRMLAASNAPLAIVSERLLGSFGRGAINIGIFIALIGSAAGGIITMPRLILALARDKLFISQLSDIHEKFQTPYKAIIFQAIVSLLVFGMAFGR